MQRLRSSARSCCNRPVGGWGNVSAANEPRTPPPLLSAQDRLHPAMLTKLKAKNSLPTQLYITLPAPNEEIFNRCCAPLMKGAWKNIIRSLKLMKGLKKKTP